MKLIRHLSDLPAAARGGAVAIGNFDGVHPGHQAVMDEAGKLAKADGVPWLVLTFEPHPRRLFQPDLAPFRLTPFYAKTRAIEALGVDYLVTLRFDQAFSETPAETFIDRVLVEGLGAKHVVTGYDFEFGHKRGGNCELLLKKGAEAGFGMTALTAHGDEGGERFASTRVRRAVTEGDMALAAELLGRLYAIETKVKHGDQRGRTIGFPTANMSLRNHLAPPYGVYAVEVTLPGETTSRPGVANLGIRPTFEGSEPRLETFLFDFSDDLYGQRLRVGLKHFIRGEKKFDGIEALKAQIAADSDEARRLLAI